MSEQNMVPSRPRASAALIGTGAFFALAGFAVMPAGVVTALTSSTGKLNVGPLYESHPNVVLLWVCVAAVLFGAVTLALGLYRLAAHADRAAGIRFPSVGSAQRPAGSPN